ncbi:MAG: zinc ribbon domain-containing protein [Defluviitaleaceae bacterium]|nr:zinc ribbon domain-containing protein [Defluviitaleaceae bacterium]
MPIYDLKCSDCGAEPRISATMADKSEKKIMCPDCGSFKLESVFKAAPGIIKNRGEAQCANRSVCPAGGRCRH